MRRIPMTMLTGLLGSGRTTLLNKTLTSHLGQDAAAIVDELDDVGIDSQSMIGEKSAVSRECRKP
jgi:G3E family GTPase